MNKSLEAYKAFIDGLLGWPRNSVKARWVREWDTDKAKPYRTPEAFNEMMSRFTSEQRQVVATLLQEERDAGIHEVLTYLEPYRLFINGVELAFEPYGSEAHHDFVCRREGDAWPEHQLEDRYRNPDESAS